jgi:squalene-hopene/tetraprenyl-beta-curcumene cyclase
MNNLNNQYIELVKLLRSEQNDTGFWRGKLSSSALATAVSIVALKLNGDNSDHLFVNNGLEWLLNHRNADGGFGDTPESKSNVSTSFLCFAAISYCGKSNPHTEIALRSVKNYLLQQDINLNNNDIAASVLSYYGKDYTFSVPILSMLIICGVLDKTIARKIPQLPFEFTLLPASWYSLFNLRVVSYAIPALIAMGIFIFKTREKHNPLMRWIRNRSVKPSLNKLESIVPESGGFLEAIPLTAFVSMCLMASGIGKNPVKVKGLDFLRNQQRPDGSWPIDADLSTWVTTLSIKAFGQEINREFSKPEISKLLTHLITIQYKKVHPFNLAQPGGWGWTNLPGSVPDVDDTSGAILALLELYNNDDVVNTAIINGCQWLTTLQNKDGGFPTFCKGWGRLPFDSSCADLTGHALLALSKALDLAGDKMTNYLQYSIRQCVARSFGFLWKAQRENGSWKPLWFGNQFTSDQTNPVYGTAKVAIYLADSILCDSLDVKLKEHIGHLLSMARQYLIQQQNTDGSWGGEADVMGTIEESALAVSALIGFNQESVLKGFQWLESESKSNGLRSNPIGLYFATLWYDEKLYPLIYYIEALRRYLK